jgi:hypothetical protein
VYCYEAEAHERGSTAMERLQFHQQHSGPVMEELHHWLETQLMQKKTEPNSGLGQAITYLLRHCRGLAAFLREAKMRHSIITFVIRALKRAVLHRKNALFYRTLNGTQFGDLVMSLILPANFAAPTRSSMSPSYRNTPRM